MTGPDPSAVAYQAGMCTGNPATTSQKLGMKMTREELQKELGDQTVAKKDQFLQELAWGSIKLVVFAFMKKNCPFLQILHSPRKYIRSRQLFDEHNLKNIAFVGNRFPEMEPVPCKIKADTFESWIKATNVDMDEKKAFYAKKENALEFFLPGPTTPDTKVLILKFWLIPLVLIGLAAQGDCNLYVMLQEMMKFIYCIDNTQDKVAKWDVSLKTALTWLLAAVVRKEVNLTSSESQLQYMAWPITGVLTNNPHTIKWFNSRRPLARHDWLAHNSHLAYHPQPPPIVQAQPTQVINTTLTKT